MNTKSNPVSNRGLYARSLIEANMDPFVTINTNGKIADVNEASVKVTGISRTKLINTDFSTYFTDPTKAEMAYLNAIKKGFTSDFPLTIKHKNGKLTDVSFNASVYKDNKGNVLGVLASARDVTSQKWALELRKANKELAYLKNEKEKKEVTNKKLRAFNYEERLNYQYTLSLIEASLDPLVTINTEGKITDMNEALANITGLTRKELADTDFNNYFTEPKKARKVYQNVFEKGFVANFPLTILHKSGKQTDVLFNGSVYKDDGGNVKGVVIVARDVTEQKRYASELTEAIVFAEMATVIAEEEKSKAEKATHIAEDAVKAKQEFLATMSHEIRTPMNAIIGFTKVILKTNLTDKQKEYLNAIKVSGDTLIVLINDILDLAKVDAGKMTFEQIPFKMNFSISAMLHLFETKISEKNLKLVKEYDNSIPKILLGDPVRLHQIILNLMSNAVKFTSKGKITFKVNLLEENDDTATIGFAISDTGIGIPEDKLESIFENFQQAIGSTSRLYGGTGLGLAIVKQLVELQGGTIKVQSRVSAGSTFSFTLIFQKTKAKTKTSVDILELNEDITDVKVLVAEDMPLNQLLIKTLLDDFGFEYDIVADGKIAIEKMQVNSYDIVLMDMHMPEMNGFEATNYIRNIMKLDIPIIALTADVTSVDLEKCKAVGMNDYIAKPIDDRLLYSKMAELVKKTPKPSTINEAGDDEGTNKVNSKPRCINLEYLTKRTKSNPILMKEMISLYLKQTPPLILAMKKGYENEDWETLYSATHKMIPSFAIVGINSVYEDMVRKVQDYANTQKQSQEIPKMVLQIENICLQAFEELEEELNAIKSSKR